LDARHDPRMRAMSRKALQKTFRVGTASTQCGSKRFDAMHDAITIETDLFEHREVKPHFINACCFGEDFALWLKRALEPLTTDGFAVSEPIQEDYGWGLWASHGKDPFWIALSFVGDDPQEEAAQWVVSVNYDPGLNLIKRLFHKPNRQAFSVLREHIWRAIRSNDAIRQIERH